MLLLEYFNELAIRPENAERLKELVLELAIRGHLTKSWRAENPDVVPADKLLEEIKAEKEELIAEKKIRKEKKLPPIASNEIPFDIPKSWEWCRLGDITQYLQRGKSPKYVNKSEIPVISQKCVQWDGFYLERARFIDVSTLPKYKEERFLVEFDMLWNSTGHGTLGRVCLFPKNQEYDRIVADSHVTVVRVFKKYISQNFLYYYSSSPTIQAFILSSATGSTKQTELSTTTLKKLLFCLPPLKEQQEIVKITQQLHQEINHLVSLATKRLSIKQSYVTAILERLEQEKTVDIWQYLQHDFIHFFDSLESVQFLRKTILQLAVQGKLTANWRENNADVESAETLLQRIQQEKIKLIKEKKIRKEKPLPSIEADEIPFDVPDSWVWCRNKDIVLEFLGGHAYKSQLYINQSKNQVIRLGNVKNGFLKLNARPVFISDKYAKETKKYKIKLDDILITMTGTKNKRDFCYILKIKEENLNRKKLYLNQRVGLLRFSHENNLNFINQSLRVDILLDNIFSKATGSANQANISKSTVLENLFPLPPLQEQQAIVKIIEELMDFCDQLETKIKENEIKEEQLMVVALNEVLGGTTIFKSKYEPKNEKPKKQERISKYDSNTINMSLVELLKKHGKLHAEDLWKMSKFPNDIDAFYAALKEAIEITKTIKESSEKGYLELV